MMTYFWDGKQLIQVDRQVSVTNCGDYLDMLCVDNYQDTDTDYWDTDYWKYGMFQKNSITFNILGAASSTWKHIPYAEFSKEFKAHLLLLL